MIGVEIPAGLETVRESVLQSPVVMLSEAAAVLEIPAGADRTIVSKSILSLQIELLTGQNVY